MKKLIYIGSFLTLALSPITCTPEQKIKYCKENNIDPNTVNETLIEDGHINPPGAPKP